MAKSYALDSVERVMRLLDCFTAETPEWRLTDLSNQLRLHKAQVLRMASTLESGGYLIRDPETKRFRLGIRLFQLGMVVRQQMDLRRVARPFLVRLVEQTGETARLVIPDEGGPICIDVVESPRHVRVYAKLGARLPWNAGSSAKVILAYAPADMRERILQQGGFQAFTDRTITDPDELRAELAVIRERGYHTNEGDLVEDTGGIGAPIFNDTGDIAGAVSLVGPIGRMGDGDVEQYLPLVVETASAISHHLGFMPAPRGDLTA